MSIATLGCIADVVAEHLRIWPDAKWHPGDDPPVGQYVLVPRSDGTFIRGLVLGVYYTDGIAHHCPSCTCKEIHGVDGWWRIRFESDNPRDNGFVTLQFPSSLRPEVP